MGWDRLKCHQVVSSLGVSFSSFLSSATPPTEDCQPLVNFQGSEMLILTIFARVLRASVKERIFGDPDSATF